jgi:phage shock protein A
MKMENDLRKELTTLRVSVARIAQVIGVDTHLEVKNKSYAELHELAVTKERGWNHLANMIVAEIEQMQSNERFSDDSYKWVAEQLKGARKALNQIETIAGIYK